MRTQPPPVVTTGLMLFALFFGAGNLIFPPVLGAESGPNFVPAIIGFLLTGVLLPLAGVIAVATSGQGISGLAARLGRGFGLAFPTVIYLAIGPLYAIPRVATVSYELATRPLLETAGWDDPWWGLLGHTVAFMAASVALAFNPTRIADRVGRWLTPALLILVGVLCVLVIAGQPRLHRPALEGFDTHPLATGIHRGYFTMDALASIVFGIVVIDALKRSGDGGRRQVLKSTAQAGLLAASLLGLVYVGLAQVGAREPGSISDGAGMLRTAANSILGSAGMAAFSALVLLACLTTSVGLLNACSTYAVSLNNRFAWRTWLFIAAGVALLLANLGLQQILVIVSPLTVFLYPMAIALIVVTLLDVVVPGHLRAAYLGAVGVAGVLGGVLALAEMGFEAPGRWLGRLPLWSAGMGWVLPALAGLGIGLLVDRRRRTVPAS